MKITELLTKLEEFKKEHEDLEVVIWCIEEEPFCELINGKCFL